MASSFRFPPVHTASPLARQIASNSTDLPPFESLGDRSTTQFPALPVDRAGEESLQKSHLFSRFATGRPRSATTQGNLQRGMFMTSIPEKTHDDGATRNDNPERQENVKVSPFNRPAALSYTNSPVMGSRALSPGRPVAQIYGTPPHNYRALPRPSPQSKTGTPHPAPPFNIGNPGAIQLPLPGSKPIDGRPTLPPPQSSSRNVELCCTSCRRFGPALSGHACTECISGLCSTCASELNDEKDTGHSVKCPSCGSVESKFKRISLDLR